MYLDYENVKKKKKKGENEKEKQKIITRKMDSYHCKEEPKRGGSSKVKLLKSKVNFLILGADDYGGICFTFL